MQINQSNLEIMEQILPNLESVLPNVREAWNEKFLSDALRLELLNNKRLTSRIFSDILSSNCPSIINVSKAVNSSKTWAALVNRDIDKLVMRLGLVWHAEQLVDPIATRQCLKSDPTISTKDLHFALTNRHLSNALPVPNEELNVVCYQAGKSILSAWLHQCDEAITEMLSISLHPLGSIFRTSPSPPAHVDFCEKCIFLIAESFPE